MGIWALIAQLLINQLLTAAILWISCGRKLQFGISKASFRSIYSFSSKIVVLSLLSQVCSSVRSLVIGKKYDADSLAYFDKGNTYSYYLYTLIDSSISRVLLPVLAKKQDEEHFNYLFDRFCFEEFEQDPSYLVVRVTVPGAEGPIY
jgi:O-antigen/teichoic acid export membrane protein